MGERNEQRASMGLARRGLEVCRRLGSCLIRLPTHNGLTV